MSKRDDRTQPPTTPLSHGIVARVVADRGFGFIRANSSDFFFHYTSLENCALTDLPVGASVSFEEVDSPKGPRAEHVTWLRAEG